MPEFVQASTGGISLPELGGRLVQRAVQVAELLISLRERGPQPNAQATLAGSLAQVSVFLLALADAAKIDLLSATVQCVAAEREAREKAMAGRTVPPDGTGAPN